ncbi:HNH endonuclease [Achromobacter xylosoxidans]
MTLDKRFAIVGKLGRKHYPHRTTKGSNAGKFVLTSESRQERAVMPVSTLEEVIAGVVFKRYRLVVSNDDQHKKRIGSLALWGPNADGYEISPDLKHLVEGAPQRPLRLLTESNTTSHSTAVAPIRAAQNFVISRVLRPALNCDALTNEVKGKIRNAELWIQRFNRVGDLYNYLQRFNADDNAPTYRDMKHCDLETFEGIKSEFSTRFQHWINDCTRASDFVVGERYSAYEILTFAKSYDTRAGGMFVVPSTGKPEVVVIKATLSGETYANEWLDPQKRLKYYFKAITRNGKQEFGEHFKANAAILGYPEIPILTFVRQSGATPFTYHGTFVHANHHSESDGSKWFELVLKESQPDNVVTDLTYLENDLNARVELSRNSTREERLARLKHAPRKPVRVAVQASAFQRNPDVIVEVLERAQGHCEGCKSPAPFISRARNEPYLEVHHRIRLADGGDDTVDNAIALCPNCHRKMHFG